jgi:predicted RNA-binding Zn ribbon-like protein
MAATFFCIRLAGMSSGGLAFELAATIRHDGRGGVADGLDTPAGVEAWIQRNASQVGELLGRPFEPAGLELDDAARARILDVRRAVRSLFARAVSPAPPSRADADRLLEPAVAVDVLNKAAGGLGRPHLEWPESGEPATRWSGRSEDPISLLIAALARSGIDFLTGPDRQRLRACPAARCVKYFLQDDPRQTWCSPSCGNRERVNRYYQRRRGEPTTIDADAGNKGPMKADTPGN